ncbi:MAG: lytic transglycosylase domain-containing protein, partial [Lachnospiraceae bacterium]|nr:lytic transglycosylase domain-containing protein [Candidatus Hippenecus merdae]
AMAAAIMMLTVAMTTMAAPGDVAIGMAPGVDAIITDVPEGKKPEAGFQESIFLTDLGLSAAQQKRFWYHAEAHGADAEQTMKIYVFYIATAWAESNFRTGAMHGNKNGTTDGGIMQVNSVNVPDLVKAGVIESARDLHDPLKGIDAGVYLADQCIRKFGVTENAYFHYNEGLYAKGKTNKNSRNMWAEYQKFMKVLVEE